MATSSEGISAEALRRHCPLAWNTPGREDTYARLGYDVIGEAFRITRDWLGNGVVTPAHLPVRLSLPFLLHRSNDVLVVRVAKQQDDWRMPDPEVTVGNVAEEKPALTARYLDEHRVTTWDDERDRDGYQILGYLLQKELVESLIATSGADADGAHVTASLTIDTTALGGGCTVVCGGSRCTHKHPH